MVIYVDFEMNKTINNQGYIISIGAIKVKNSMIIDEFHQLCSLPDCIEEVDAYITVLTGIKTEDLINKPNFHKIFKQFICWAKDCNSIFCWDSADVKSIYYSYQMLLKTTNISESEIKNMFSCIKKKFVDLKPYISEYDCKTKKMKLSDIYKATVNKPIDTKKLHSPVFDSILLKDIHSFYIKKLKNKNYSFSA